VRASRMAMGALAAAMATGGGSLRSRGGRRGLRRGACLRLPPLGWMGSDLSLPKTLCNPQSSRGDGP
jgi:hypothetical protein